jgi:hypothetical protein
MFIISILGLLLWLGMDVLGLAPTKSAVGEWMVYWFLMCTCSQYYQLLRVYSNKRETSDWLKARFKEVLPALPLIYYFSLLGLPLEEILIFDWSSTLLIVLYWRDTHQDRYVPRRERWSQPRLMVKDFTRRLRETWYEQMQGTPLQRMLDRWYHEFLHDKLRKRSRWKPSRRWDTKSTRHERVKRNKGAIYRVPMLAFATVAGLHNEGMAFPPAAAARMQRFDSDSRPWLIDNCLTACISNRKEDFVGKLQRVQAEVKGIGGPMMVSMKGTLRWSIEDDQGVTHTFNVPDSYYAPKSPVCLFSPQHWAQNSPYKDNAKRNWLVGEYAAGRKGTWAGTFDDGIEMHWDHNRFHRIIPLDKATNVGKIYTAPGARKFRVFKATFDAASSQEEPMAFNAHVIPDDDDPSVADYQKSVPETAEQANEGPMTCKLTSTSNEDKEPVLMDWNFHDREDPVRIEDENEAENSSLSPTAELLRIHYQLSHLPFSAIRLMAANGHLPRKLIDCRVPKCAGCLFGKATKRPWRTKPSSTSKAKIKLTTEPGQCVSVDQLESPSPGLFAQLKGIPTTRRYQAATIFVDHYSRLSYVHLQSTLSSEDTVQAKHAFEKFAKSHGVSVKHYHCDNGRFADNAFLKDVREQRQNITYCGVNAHFQNGIAERRIRELQDMTRTALLHAMARWPRAINTHLWPYALRTANDVLVSTPKRVDGRSAIGVFSGSEVTPKIDLLRPFGCPVYVLDNALQGGKHIQKWFKRSRVGIYLGMSPNHARSVALVLNIQTGLASPQFHIKFDDLFETVRQPKEDQLIQWQVATHFSKKMASRNKTSEGARTQQLSTGSSSEKSVAPEDPPSIPPEPPPDDFPTVNETLTGNEMSAETQENEGATAPNRGGVRWSTRHKPSQRLRESLSQGLLSFHSVFSDIDGDEEYLLQEAMSNPLAYAASADKDTMYLHQAMRQPDKKQFVQAMVDEVTAHTKNGHWRIIPKSQVPVGTKVLPSVWAMKRKRRILTREVYKWKARLNVHGGKQELGINYWDTYAATLSWPPIRFMLTVALIKGWHTRQIDFTLAYPQADIECDMYMEIPQGFTFNGSRKTHCLQLVKNLYGQRQAGRTWQQHLNRGLRDNGFAPSQADECIWYRGKVTFLYYVDDGIFVGPCSKEIDSIIAALQKTFNLTDEGDLSDYLGIKVSFLPGGKISLTQPHLIATIIEDMKFTNTTKPKLLPACSSSIIQRDLDGEAFDEHWDYRSVIGKLNFLEKSTRPDIAYAVHQCARFSSNPKKSHANAVKQIVRYFIGTKDQGIILNPTGNEFEVYCDSNFVGDYNQDTASYDVMTAKSRGGHVIMYAGCPMLWSSKMLSEVTLSTTESEYCEISNALRSTIPLMSLVNEIRERYDANLVGVPVVKCEVFEDNSGAVELSMVHKMRPRTKHINVKYHHFREHVRKKLIRISHVPSEENCADSCTKPLGKDLFEKHRLTIQGW